VATWREANPGYDDLVAAEDFESSIRRTPEPEYRTKRCNQWVTTTATWLPYGTWAACAEPRPIPDLAEVVLGFDGSFSNDSTALIAVEVGEVPHVDVAACWEKPPDADSGWRVPIVDVEEAIRQACRRWSVREIVCDPFRWARTYQVLEDEGLPIVEFPQSPQRMVPATGRFYEAVLNGGVTHSDDPRLARHMDNCMLKVDGRGARLAKDARNSPRKIDLAVAAVMAFDRASTPTESLEPFGFFD
jgi:phage terminase large subunit-like protein